jgi:hypothetical protein
MMKKYLVVATLAVAALGVNVGVASASTSTKATVTHYTASYSCPCFGDFTIAGVHLTNTQFPGTDNGTGTATGGRDNFSGTVSDPPPAETVWNYTNAGEWQSDYDGQHTTHWSVTFEPDGSLTGWAVYPTS